MKTQLLFFLLYVPQVKDLLLVGHEKGKTNNCVVRPVGSSVRVTAAHTLEPVRQLPAKEWILDYTACH